ncbi:nucleoside hydrolase [Saccharothrix violaceirubra]|uniref:Purine nucleosidase n=1 Tax=Saccharothrix violaceirubra TaxID=413306 RepID=A0A7W7WX85_9PSEU|nr:nucleoside hydrolase [Saccharothrix violaceirubra]MBB4966856.1 purine nucleosidase [Saccharothrix violaceirubra]
MIDTDPGIDDALAILYLATRPEVEIVAIGTVHGNTTAHQAALNILRVLDIADHPDVPVAVGAARPLAQPLHTAEFVHGPDGLGGHPGPPSTRDLAGTSAAEQLVRLARDHPGGLTLLALGPLTNLALALLLEPELPHLVGRVVAMGGALAVPGNITPYAEANLWHDPEAADLVLAAGFDLTLVPLDVTESVRADRAWYDALAHAGTRRARFATAILRHYGTFYETVLGRPEYTLHDPLAAVLTLDPALAEHRMLPVAVELTGTHTRGRLVADLRLLAEDADLPGVITDRAPVAVATAVDAPIVLDRLLSALT